MRETTIKMTKDAITVETINDQGMRSLKHTNLETVQNLLAAEQRFETPLLPGQWGCQQYIKRDNEEYWVMSVPADIREVRYDFRNNDVDEDRTFRIPVPASVWLIRNTINPDGTRRLHHAMVYALKNPIMTENDILYKMPFSNVGSSVCWGGGSSSYPVLGKGKAGGKSIQSLPTQFFLRAFNNDLGDNRFESFPDGREGRDGVSIFRVQHLFEWLDFHLKAAQEKGEVFTFPENKLVRVGSLSSAKRSLFGF